MATSRVTLPLARPQSHVFVRRRAYRSVVVSSHDAGLGPVFGP